MAFPVVSFALVALLVSVSITHAATYYVKNGGNDSANGESDANAWATIGKVNGRSFNPGDSVLFKRGSTWSGVQLTISSSGNSSSVLTFGAYGSGAKPVIDGNGTATNCVRLDGRSHVTIEDLVLENSDDDGLAVVNGSHVTVQRVDVSDTGNIGILATNGDNIRIDGCTVTNADNNGIMFRGSAAPRLRDSIIENCTVTNTQANDGIVLHEEWGTNEVLGSNFTIRNNVSTGSYEQGYDITTGTNVLVEGNFSSGNGGGAFDIFHSSSNVTVRNHWSENEPTRDTAQTVKIGVADVTVEYSVFIGSATRNKPVIKLLDGAEDVVLRNNTVLWNHSSNGNLFHFNAGCTTENLTMTNNIFASLTSAKGIMNFAEATRSPAYSTFAFDYNLYHANGGAQINVNGSAKTFPDYQSLYGQDVNGLEDDPEFVNAGSALFDLQSTSPAIDAGDDVGLDADFDGVSVPQGSAPDIGAYEFVQATVAAPTFNPAPGSYSSAQNVTLSSTTTGASIRYTTDGSTPTPTSGTVYSSAINVASSTTIKAIAYKSGLTDSAVVSGTFTIASTVTRQVAASADDDETNGNLNSPDLELGNLFLGVRFTNVTVPQGATITSAKVTFQAESGVQSTASVTIYAQDVNNAPNFASGQQAPDVRTRTSASASWSGITSISNVSTPDIAAVIQEVVDRGGWSSGNALVVLFQPNGGRADAAAYDYGASSAPVLEIIYE